MPLPSPPPASIYLGNGCFWERQWAYANVETNVSGPFARAAGTFSAKVGYAGGRAPPSGAAVCYHSNDDRDYTALGHAEVVRVRLDGHALHAQASALARDRFRSYTGGHGQRVRPDPMDRGLAYRSLIGLAGGVGSPLYPTIAAQNTFGMALRAVSIGGEPDALNTVYIYDSDAFPFYDGEVYHQCHCNFFASEGMPYPTSYTRDTWQAKQRSGEYAPTGCPENAMPHPGWLCPG
jgi:peptide methionine sulfoxide reductase MsrA